MQTFSRHVGIDSHGCFDHSDVPVIIIIHSDDNDRDSRGFSYFMHSGGRNNQIFYLSENRNITILQ